MSGILYVVGTPIGNLSDMAPRAVQVLSSVDFIAAEDTRVTLKLLNHFDIKKPLVSYYEHNRTQKGEIIVERILGGESCAIVTDAGMPCISDPGEDLVRLCRQNSVTVNVVPGPTAVMSALAISGLDCSRFCFEGFLSTTKKNRFEHLSSLENESRTMVFYEAPHKLKATVEDMMTYFGEDRKICLCRELTKLHEEAILTDLKGAKELYLQTEPRGEFVLVIEGKAKADTEQMSVDDCLEAMAEMVASGKSKSEAARLAAKKSGFKKNDLYKLLVGEKE